MLTLSVVRTGAEHVDPTVLMAAKAALHRAVVSGLIIDGQVAARGEDVSLIMSHRRGADAPSIHGLL
jgi:fructose 1,6-bisphosphate aldolase/phosphatase